MHSEGPAEAAVEAMVEIAVEMRIVTGNGVTRTTGVKRQGLNLSNYLRRALMRSNAASSALSAHTAAAEVI